jgi:hypothetical protein
MDAAYIIRNSVARVTALREAAAAHGELQAANMAVKKLQARRFAGTYADLLASREYSGAARFFLEELYSDKDYSLRDAQFSRIAGALQTFFPDQVVATAVALAELHALTEELDQQMAQAWLAQGDPPSRFLATRYMNAWKAVARSTDRNRQLAVVLQVGAELDRLTRTPGLRMMLRMMRKPANMAGLGALQSFLKAGFDTFAAMAGKGSKAKEFLEIIRTRESRWLDLLYESDAAICETELTLCLEKAP